MKKNIEEQIAKKFEAQFSKVKTENSNLSSMLRKISLLEKEINEANKLRSFLEKETNESFDYQKAQASQIKKDLDILSFQIKEKFDNSNRIVKIYQETMNKKEKIEYNVKLLNNQLNSIEKEKDKIQALINSLENDNANMKSNTLSKIEEIKKLNCLLEEINQNIQKENRFVETLQGGNKRTAPDNKLEEAEIEKTIAKLNYEIHLKENKIFEMKQLISKNEVFQQKKTLCEYEEKLQKKKLKKKAITDEIEEIKSTISEAKKYLEEQKKVYKKLKDQIDLLNKFEFDTFSYVKKRESFGRIIKETVEILSV